MFSPLVVDSSQSLEGTLNLNFLFASFKRVEKDTYLGQMPTLVHGKIQNKTIVYPACTIDRDSKSDFCDRNSRSDFGVVVERANHNFLEGVPSLYL